MLQSDPSLARELLGWTRDARRSRTASRRPIDWLRAPARPGARTRPVSSSEPRIALAEPTIGGNARALPRRVPAARTSCRRSGRSSSRFEAAFAASVGAALRRRLRVGHGRDPPRAARARRRRRATRSSSRPDLRRLGQPGPLRRGDAGPRRRRARRPTTSTRRSSSTELDRRARAGRRQPAAIEVVHLLGHPADLEPVVDGRRAPRRAGHRGRLRGARRDATSAGAFAGRQVGTIGRVGCFSFNGNKLITTGGGGMLVTDDEALARRARHLSTQARLPGRRLRPRRGRLQLPAVERRAPPSGSPSWSSSTALLAGRRANAAGYDAAIARPPGASCRRRARPWADPSFWLYTAALDRPAPGLTRDDAARGARPRRHRRPPDLDPAPPDAAVPRRRGSAGPSRTTSSTARSACPRRRTSVRNGRPGSWPRSTTSSTRWPAHRPMPVSGGPQPALDPSSDATGPQDHRGQGGPGPAGHQRDDPERDPVRPAATGPPGEPGSTRATTRTIAQ